MVFCGPLGLGILARRKGVFGLFEIVAGRTHCPLQKGLTLSLLCLVPKYNPLNLSALDWSLLSKNECLKYGGRLLGDSCQFVPDLALLSFILFFGTYSMTLALKKFKFSRYFPTKVSLPPLSCLEGLGPAPRSMVPHEPRVTGASSLEHRLGVV